MTKEEIISQLEKADVLLKLLTTELIDIKNEITTQADKLQDIALKSTNTTPEFLSSIVEVEARMRTLGDRLKSFVGA